MKFEIYYDDLTDIAKKRLDEIHLKERRPNIPLAIIDFEATNESPVKRIKLKSCNACYLLFSSGDKCPRCWGSDWVYREGHDERRN